MIDVLPISSLLRIQAYACLSHGSTCVLKRNQVMTGN
jgi:hypothetical protein